MTKAEFIALNPTRGAFISIEYISKADNMSASNKKAGHTGYAVTRKTIRTGLNYENTGLVKEMRESGIAPSPRKWGITDPDDDRLILNPKNGRSYLKAFNTPNAKGQNISKTYFIDGTEVDKATYYSYLIPSASNPNSDYPVEQSIPLENIIRLGK